MFGTYDFGLTAEQETRAARLHADSIVVDMLFQGPVGYRSYTDDMRKELAEDWESHRNAGKNYGRSVMQPIRAAVEGRFPEFREIWEASGITAGNRQAGLDEVAVTMSAAQLQFDRFDWLDKALCAADIRAAKAGGRRAGFISTQNTTGLDGKTLDLVQYAYDLGMRMMGLAYNTQNVVASGCTDRADGGVSSYGARVIARMNELGMIVDTCHCGRRSTMDACELSERPVVSSHNSAHALYPIDRARTDPEIEAIAGTGGVVGVYAVPFFLAAGADVTVEAMLDHIDHIARLVGWQHVGIGTDWPLQSPKDVLSRVLMPMVFELGFRPEHNIEPEANLVGFDDYRDFPNITRGLVARGYTDEQITGIIGGNFLRVFEQVCG